MTVGEIISFLERHPKEWNVEQLDLPSNNYRHEMPTIRIVFCLEAKAK